MPGVGLLDEELAVEALAHEAALHVGERDDDRVDRAPPHLDPQLLEAQHTLDPIPSYRLTTLCRSARNSA